MLWYDGKAEEAARFYTSLFPDSHIDKVVTAPGDNPSSKAGEVLTVEFTINGSPFVALNGGPEFKFTEAISLAITCDDQAEIDRSWVKLVEDGGEHSVCGWLKDRYGVSWQVTPKRLNDMIESPNRDAARRAMEAMLEMTKLDIAQLTEAFEGVPA